MTPGEAVTGAGYGVGAVVFLWAARRHRLATEGIGLVAVWGFLAAVVGAKLTQLIAEGWPARIPLAVAANPQAGGRALLGGVIFGWIGVEIAKRRLGIRRSTGDLFALALPAGEAVGRIGCYLNGCCYGERCDLPWSVWQHDAWRHPAQLYSAAVAAGLFAWLLRSELRRGSAPLPEGVLFRRYLIGFAITRFGLEFLRWRETLVWGLSPMQWFCLELAVFVALTEWRHRRRAVLVQG